MDNFLNLISKKAGDSLSYKLAGPGATIYAPRNFIISGGTPDERLSPFLQMYSKICGKLPVIMLHNRNPDLEQCIYGMCRQNSCTDRLFIVNRRQRRTADYEYLKMGVQGIVNTLSQLACDQGYQVSGQFQIALRSLISLLQDLNLGTGLTGLERLSVPAYAQFRSLLDRNGISSEQANRIAEELDRDNKPEYYYAFQAIISRLANEAGMNGWGSAGETDRSVNISETIAENATLLLELDPANCKSLLTCIANEILELNTDRFLLVVDGINLVSEQLLNLFLSGRDFRCGFIGENVVSLVGDDQHFAALSERASVFLIFKHKTGKIASYFSEIIGCEDVQRTETSEGTSKEAFKILPGGVHKDIRYSIENRYRVMPEDILALPSCELFLFDSLMNKCERI